MNIDHTVQQVKEEFKDFHVLSAEERKGVERTAKLAAKLSARLATDPDYEYYANAEYIESIAKDFSAIVAENTKTAIETVLPNLVGILFKAI